MDLLIRGVAVKGIQRLEEVKVAVGFDVIDKILCGALETALEIRDLIVLRNVVTFLNGQTSPPVI